MATDPLAQNLDIAADYQALYDALGRAYWDATDVGYKDLIHGAQESVGEIITAIDAQELADNTSLFIQIGGKIKLTNDALKKIQDNIDSITKNLNTAASVISGITKVLAYFP